MTKLIVGLGNPGPKYERTRHNVGFQAVDRLVSLLSLPDYREKFHGLYTKGSVNGQDVVVLKPLTFMNLSGQAVQAASTFFHAAALADEMLVLHDELDIPFADVRFKVGGGHAGHNGLRSIIGALGAAFSRVRIGIGRPPAEFRGEIADFVLAPFSSIEIPTVPTLSEAASKLAFLWVEKGVSAASASPPKPQKPKKPRPVDATATGETTKSDALPKDAVQGRPPSPGKGEGAPS